MEDRLFLFILLNLSIICWTGYFYFLDLPYFLSFTLMCAGFLASWFFIVFLDKEMKGVKE